MTADARWVTVAALFVACGGPESPGAEGRLYPVQSVDAEGTSFEYGPGSLETTSDAAWAGSAVLAYPAVLDDAAPVVLEVHGLDLSQIEYTGDMGWPPDETDAGAVARVVLLGTNEVSYRIWSSVADRLDQAPLGTEGALEPADFRSYLFHGYNNAAGAYGIHNLRMERWGPEGSRGPYNTVDLRLRYEDGLATAWVRLHASLEWDEGGRARGAACPWNVALNSAVPGTADSVWTGECRVDAPGETGRAVGAWIPVDGGRWRVAERPGSVRAALSIANWQNATGPYRVSWQNVVVSGTPDPRIPTSSGEGTLRPFGTGEGDVEPRGEWAEFSYLVVAQGSGVPATALLRYRATGFELASRQTDWVVLSEEEARFAGRASVNGRPGYRYELRGGVGRAEDPGRLSLQVWSPGASHRPHYVAFGALVDGSIEVRRLAQE